MLRLEQHDPLLLPAPSPNRTTDAIDLIHVRDTPVRNAQGTEIPKIVSVFFGTGPKRKIKVKKQK